jgi:hypothetical protein
MVEIFDVSIRQNAPDRNACERCVGFIVIDEQDGNVSEFVHGYVRLVSGRFFIALIHA